MTIDVAVDGGQSSLRLAVIEDGLVEETVEVAGFQYVAGEDPVHNTTRAVLEALALSGCTQPVRRICLGLTSVPPDADGKNDFAAHLLKVIPASEVWTAGDMVTAHAGALAGAPGVVIAAGTGAICLGINGIQAVRSDGLGYLLGDDGSGFAIGQAAIRAALRARENRGPDTELVAAMEEHFGDVDGFPHSIYSAGNPVAEIAAFSRAAAQIARDGDLVAANIWSEAVDRLVDSTISVARRCFPGSSPRQIPVSYTGRLFDASEQLLEPFIDRLSTRCPEVDLRPPRGTPLDGAVRLIRDGLGSHRSLVTVAVSSVSR